MNYKELSTEYNKTKLLFLESLNEYDKSHEVKNQRILDKIIMAYYMPVEFEQDEAEGLYFEEDALDVEDL